ncbi:fibrous sheath-interacting protein 2-like [Ambystoma mexicanum]|uniref:fibrous sheath-interacting protein 2-like n=1 Tax=Ambystoma mexicanum TaxID=8296 RepID=UPI0037E89A87
MIAVTPLDLKMKTTNYEHPTSSGFEDESSQPCFELCERGRIRSNENEKVGKTPMDMLKASISVLKNVQPQMRKITEDVIESTFKNIVKELNYSLSLVNNNTDNCFTFIRDHHVSEYPPKVKVPTELTEKDISKLEVSYVAKDVTENIFVKLKSAVVETCNTSTIPLDQPEEYKEPIKTSRSKLIIKQPKQVCSNSQKRPSVTFVSGITKEIIHTVSNKLEAFAVSKQTFINISQMPGIRNSQTQIFTRQLRSTSRSVFNQVIEKTQPNNQRDILDPFNVTGVMKQNQMHVSRSGTDLFNCIGDILKSILGSILKELDQDNHAKGSSQHVFPLQERVVLLGLITNILNDVNALRGEDIVHTVTYEATEKGLQDIPIDQRCPIITPEPKQISPQLCTLDYKVEKEKLLDDFNEKVIFSENEHEESSASIHISSSSETEASRNSDNDRSDSTSLCENTLHDIEVMASKNKIRPLIKTVEYFVNDTLAKIMADEKFPYSSYFCPADWEIAFKFAPESHLNAKHPFAATDVLAFVLHNVESIFKLLSLAFDYNILSHTIDFPALNCAPFMGLCADLKVYKEGMMDKIHEVPKEYVFQLMNILIKKNQEQGKNKFVNVIEDVDTVCPLQSVAQSTILRDIYELIVRMIVTELKQFLESKSKSNFEQYQIRNISINKIPAKPEEKQVVQVSQRMFTNADMSLASPPSSPMQHKGSLVNLCETTGTTIQMKGDMLPLQIDLNAFAKQILNAILNAIQNAAANENQAKDSSVITSTTENNTIRKICDLISEASYVKLGSQGQTNDTREISATLLHKPVVLNLHGCVSLATHGTQNKEQVEKEIQHAFKITSGIINTPENTLENKSSQSISDHELDKASPHPLLQRVSKISEHSAAACINKMCPIVRAATTVISNTLAHIMEDAECHSCLKNYNDKGQLKPIPLFSESNVLLFTIDITESMLKMLSVAFEQAGAFPDTANSPFMGLCADLWLLKEDIGCLTSLVEVDMSFVNVFVKKDHVQESGTKSASMTTIGQNMIHVISKKLSHFLQLDYKSDREHEIAEKKTGTDTALEITLIPKLYPYAREVSEAIFNLISNAIDEEQKNSFSSGDKQTEEKVSIESICNSISRTSSTEANNTKSVGASTELQKTKNEKDQQCLSYSEIFVSSGWERDEKEITNESAGVAYGLNYLANQEQTVSNPGLMQLQNNLEFVFRNIFQKIEEESKAPQRSQIIQIVKQIVTDIFQNYFVDLLLPHIYNNPNHVDQSYKKEVTEALLKLNNKTADTLISSSEMSFLAHDVVKLIFQKLRCAFLSNTNVNTTQCLKEYKHPVHGRIIVEQINNLCEKSTKGATQYCLNPMFTKDISDQMENNSNNKLTLTDAQNSESDLRTQSPLIYNFMDDVLETVLDIVETFAAAKVECIFSLGNQNTNTSAKTSTLTGVQPGSHLLGSHYQSSISKSYVDEGTHFSVSPNYNHDTPTENGNTLFSHLLLTKLHTHAKEATNTIFKGIKNEIQTIPPCSNPPQESTVAGIIVNGILDTMQDVDKYGMSLKSQTQEHVLLENNLSKVPVFRQELEFQTSNTVQHVLNDVFQRRMYDIENIAYVNSDHNNHNVYHKLGSESNKHIIDVLKANTFISKPDVKFVSRDMVGIVLDNLLSPTKRGSKNSSPDSSRTPDLPNAAANNMIKSVASRLKSFTSLPIDSKFIADLKSKKENCFHDICNENEDHSELSATGQVPIGEKRLPSTHTSCQLPITDHSQSVLNVNAGKIVGSILTAIESDLDKTIELRDSKQSKLCKQSIAAKSIVSTILEIISPDKNCNHINASMTGVCQNAPLYQQTAEITKMKKNGFRVGANYSQISCVNCECDECNIVSSKNNILSEKDKNKIMHSQEKTLHLVPDTTTKSKSSSAFRYQQQTVQNILQAIIATQRNKGEETFSCLTRIEDVLQEIIQRVVTDLGHLPISLPYFIKGTMHYACNLSVTQPNIISCIDILTFESKSEALLQANKILETTLEKVYFIILKKVHQEEALIIENKFPHIAKTHWSGLADGEKENTCFMLKNKLCSEVNGNGKKIPSKEFEDLVQHVGDHFKSFISSRLEQISVSEPSWKPTGLNEFTSFCKRNKPMKETIFHKIKMSKPLLILPSFSSTQDPKKLLSCVYVSESVLADYTKYVLHDILQVFENQLKLETYHKTALGGDSLPLSNITSAINTVGLLLTDLRYGKKKVIASPIDKFTLPRHQSSGPPPTSLVVKPHNAKTNGKAQIKPRSTKNSMHKMHLGSANSQNRKQCLQNISKIPNLSKSEMSATQEKKVPLLPYYAKKIETFAIELSTDLPMPSKNVIAVDTSKKTQTIHKPEMIHYFENGNQEKTISQRSSNLDTFIEPKMSACALDRICVKTPSENPPNNLSQCKSASNVSSQASTPLKNQTKCSQNYSGEENAVEHSINDEHGIFAVCDKRNEDQKRQKEPRILAKKELPTDKKCMYISMSKHIPNSKINSEAEMLHIKACLEPQRLQLPVQHATHQIQHSAGQHNSSNKTYGIPQSSFFKCTTTSCSFDNPNHTDTGHLNSASPSLTTFELKNKVPNVPKAQVSNRSLNPLVPVQLKSGVMKQIEFDKALSKSSASNSRPHFKHETICLSLNHKSSENEQQISPSYPKVINEVPEKSVTDSYKTPLPPSGFNSEGLEMSLKDESINGLKLTSHGKNLLKGENICENGKYIQIKVEQLQSPKMEYSLSYDVCHDMTFKHNTVSHHPDSHCARNAVLENVCPLTASPNLTMKGTELKHARASSAEIVANNHVAQCAISKTTGEATAKLPELASNFQKGQEKNQTGQSKLPTDVLYDMRQAPNNDNFPKVVEMCENEKYTHIEVEQLHSPKMKYSLTYDVNLKNKSLTDKSIRTVACKPALDRSGLQAHSLNMISNEPELNPMFATPAETINNTHPVMYSTSKSTCVLTPKLAGSSSELQKQELEYEINQIYPKHCDLHLIKPEQYCLHQVYQASFLENILSGLVCKILFASSINAMCDREGEPYEDELVEHTFRFLKSMLDYLTQLKIKIVKTDEINLCFSTKEKANFDKIVHSIYCKILHEYGSQHRVYAALVNNSIVFAKTMIDLVLKDMSNCAVKNIDSKNLTSYSFIMLDADNIIQKVIRDISKSGNPWQALSMNVALLFANTCLEDIINNLLSTIFPSSPNITAQSEREHILSEDEFNVVAAKLKHKVLCNIADYKTWNANNSNLKQYLQTGINIQKVVELVHGNILYIYKSPEAIQTAFAASIETVLEKIAKIIILEMTHHLQQYFSEEIAKGPHTSSDNSIAIVSSATNPLPLCQKRKQLTSHVVYLASFLEDVISKLLCNIYCALNVPLEDEEEPNIIPRATTLKCVDYLVKELIKSPVKFVQTDRMTIRCLLTTNDVNRIADSIFHKVLKAFGTQQAIKSYIMTPNNIFAERINCLLLAEITDYQIQQSHLLELSSHQYVTLEANNIVEKLLKNVTLAREQDVPDVSPSIRQSRGCVEDILVRLISKFFAAVGTDCTIYEGTLSDSEFRKTTLTFLHAVMNDISNHDITFKWSETFAQYSKKNISNIVDQIYNKLLKKYGTQVVVQEKINSGRSNIVKETSHYLIKVISRCKCPAIQKNQTCLSSNSTPTVPGDVKHIQCCTHMSEKQSEGNNHGSVYSSVFVEEIISGILSKLFIRILDHILIENNVSQSYSRLQEVVLQFVNSLLVEIESSQVKIANICNEKYNRQLVDVVVNSVVSKILEEYENDIKMYRCLNCQSDAFVKKMICFVRVEISEYKLKSSFNEDISLFSYTSLDSKSIVSKVVKNLIKASKKCLSLSNMLESKTPLTSVQTTLLLQTGVRNTLQKNLNHISHPQLIVLSCTILDEIVAKFLIKLFFNCTGMATSSKDITLASQVKSITQLLLSALTSSIFEKQIHIAHDNRERDYIHPKDNKTAEKIVEAIYSKVYQLCGSHWSIYKHFGTKSKGLPQTVASLMLASMSNYPFQPCHASGILSNKYLGKESSYFVKRVLNYLSSLPPLCHTVEAREHGVCIFFVEGIVNQILTKIFMSCNVVQSSRASSTLQPELRTIAEKFINTLLKKMLQSKMSVTKQVKDQNILHPDYKHVIAAVADSVYIRALKEYGCTANLWKDVTFGSYVVPERIACLIIKEISKYELHHFSAVGMPCESYTDTEVSKMVERILCIVRAPSVLPLYINKIANKNFSVDQRKPDACKGKLLENPKTEQGLYIQSVTSIIHLRAGDVEADHDTEDTATKGDSSLMPSKEGFQMEEDCPNDEQNLKTKLSSLTRIRRFIKGFNCKSNCSLLTTSSQKEDPCCDGAIQGQQRANPRFAKINSETKSGRNRENDSYNFVATPFKNGNLTLPSKINSHGNSTNCQALSLLLSNGGSVHQDSFVSGKTPKTRNVHVGKCEPIQHLIKDFGESSTPVQQAKRLPLLRASTSLSKLFLCKKAYSSKG